MAALELEGTWEEILKHSAELSGRRVKVSVLSKEPTPAPSSSLDEATRQWLDEVERLDFKPGAPREGQEAEIEELIVEKFRKQGLNL